MTRRVLREHIAQMLFGIEFHEKDDIEEQAQGYIEGLEECNDKDAEYMLTKLKKIVDVVEFSAIGLGAYITVPSSAVIDFT